jgi:predicted TIM-barrel fold metal-dependent hydrolase
MRIDAHIHYADDDPALLSLLESRDLKLHNICVVHSEFDGWRAQAELYRDMAARFPQRFAWCTSFDLPDFNDPTWADRAITGLATDFAAGAVACKVWKNVGMEARKPDGSFLMVDDPIFDPVFEYLAGVGKTLLMHIAEPLACWQPLTPDSPHYNYYSRNPQWHMFNRPEFLSHATLIAARDRVAAKYPRLPIVGAHLGSLEYDVDEVAARLDRYPNFAVDMSARLADLAVQPSSKVRKFFEQYADRILFGTDVVMRQRPSTLDEAARSAAIQQLDESYALHFAYFDQSAELTVRGFNTTGLALPAAIQDLFYHDNALRWYPGI